ncbi:MAG: hypothetical protein EHM14_01855 [Methanothrix sp.]|nr:MAG: hypothetical protein EHM14_01855 [Methanothrix sp.]
MNSIMTVFIALVAITALGGMAQAVDFEITGQVDESIEVTAPASPAMTFAPGAGSWQNAGEIGLSTNSDSWSVKLVSDKAKMSNKLGYTDTLGSALKASASSSGTSPITLGTSEGTLASGVAASTSAVTLYLNQTVAWTDKPHDDYSMNITITGSVT